LHSLISSPYHCPIICMPLSLFLNNKNREHKRIDVGSNCLVILIEHRIRATHVQANTSYKYKLKQIRSKK
jgi:hypothetical protein